MVPYLKLYIEIDGKVYNEKEPLTFSGSPSSEFIDGISSTLTLLGYKNFRIYLEAYDGN